MKTISAGAFFRSERLISITIPEKVTSIGTRVFHSFKCLHSVVIHGSVETLCEVPFIWCIDLMEIRVVGKTQNLKMDDSVLFNKDMTRIVWCTPNKGGYVIPDTVSVLDENAFIVHIN